MDRERLHRIREHMAVSLFPGITDVNWALLELDAAWTALEQIVSVPARKYSFDECAAMAAEARRVLGVGEAG